MPLDSDELRDTFWAQTQGLERGSSYWFQIEPGIEDALGNSTALQETPVATFSIYPQKGGIVYPRSNRVFQPKDPTKGFWMVFYEAIDEAGAATGGITLVNQNDESDTVSVAIAEKNTFRAKRNYTGLTPLSHFFPINGIWCRSIWHSSVQRVRTTGQSSVSRSTPRLHGLWWQTTQRCVLNRWK